MDKKIDLTIIIPHYNTPSLLERLLKSIPKRKDMQIIVVDDNSNVEIEKFQAIKERYSKNVEFYRNNTGVQSAGTCRNIGLESAKGKWILFADADDFFLPCMYDIVKKYFSSNFDIIFFVPTSIFLDTGEISNRHLAYERRVKEYLADSSLENTINLKSARAREPWSKMIRRELIEKKRVRFSQSLYANDLLFSTVIGYYAKNIYASEETIYCITRSRGTLSTRMDERAYDIRLDEYIKVWQFIIEKYGLTMFKKLHLNGAVQIYLAVRQHYGVNKYIQVIKKLRKERIPIFNVYAFCPSYFWKAFCSGIKYEHQNKVYHINENSIPPAMLGKTE